MNLSPIYNVFNSLPSEHLQISVLSILISLFIVSIHNRLKNNQFSKYFDYLLLVPILIEIIYFIMCMWDGVWSINNSLPFEFSYITSLSASVYFFKRTRFLLSVLYFAGLWSSFAAFLNTNLLGNEPWYLLLKYYGHHGLTLYYGISCYILGFRPNLNDYYNAIKYTLTVIASVALFNIIFGSNYMFTQSKPGGVNLSQIMPEWPFYLLIIILMGLTFYSLILLIGIKPKINDSNLEN